MTRSRIAAATALRDAPSRYDAAHAGPLSVPVKLPLGVDPAAVSSAVEAMEKALVLIAQASEGHVIARADRLAEMAVGLLEPSRDLLEDRLERMKTLRELTSQGQWLSAEQVNTLQSTPPRNKAQPASDWKRRGRLFSVGIGGREYFPAYQFDAMNEPLPVIREVLEAYGDVADPWVLAGWFHYPNGWISDAHGAPAAPKDALDRRTAVVNAARHRHSSYVA